MKKPLFVWKNTLGQLGFRVNWDSFWEAKKSRGNHKKRQKTKNSQLGFEALEKRQLLAADMVSITLYEDAETSIVDLRTFFETENEVSHQYQFSQQVSDDDILSATIYEWALELDPQEDANGTVDFEIQSVGTGGNSIHFTIDVEAVNDAPYLSQILDPIYLICPELSQPPPKKI